MNRVSEVWAVYSPRHGRSFPLWPGVSLTVLICFCFAGFARAEGPYLSNGVKMGDLDQTSLVVWTRLGETPTYDPETYVIPAASGQVNLAYRSAEESEWTSAGWQDVLSKEDGILKTRFPYLKPGTAYRLRVLARTSEGGEVTDRLEAAFRTPPAAEEAAPVQFAIMTCQKFLSMDDGENGFLTYRTLAGVPLDFASHTGDAVYYDQEPLLAKNQADARTHWHRMYSLPNVKRFNRGVPVFMVKDDHDTLRDDCYRGQSYGDLTFEQGVRIHKEQNPVGDRPYRTLRWGRDLQVWFVEGREFRSNNRDPDGPEKTILGREQIQWLEETIPASDATFKLFVGATPLVGPDRKSKSDNHSNSNFQHEGRWLREFLSDHDVISINGDRHWQYVSRDPETQLWEFGTGPVLDARAQGWKKNDRRPEHRFLRVAGGYLLGNVGRHDDQVSLVLSHHDVNGKETHRETFIKDTEAR